MPDSACALTPELHRTCTDLSHSPSFPASEEPSENLPRAALPVKDSAWQLLGQKLSVFNLEIIINLFRKSKKPQRIFKAEYFLLNADKNR